MLWIAFASLVVSGCSTGMDAAPTVSDRTSARSSAALRVEAPTPAIGAATSPYRVLWSFLGKFGGPHGASPQAGLAALDGVLYGTTEAGGASGGGSVFSVTPAGTETLLHNFSAIYSGSADGNEPQTDLLAVGPTLYGTTIWGGGSGCGGSGCGTVYAITPSGSETTLYRFRGGTDGSFPSALIEVDGALYGTTMGGGGDNPKCNGGCGTVFKLSSSGEEQIVYRFKGQDDGLDPDSGLVDLDGTLYGTADVGGRYAYGTAFRLSTAGQLTTLHHFGNGLDGAFPDKLIAVNGELYGTTSTGGAGCVTTGGCGTVFEMTTTGSERVIYSFHGGSDGAGPFTGLTNVNGTLYGVTHDGGAANDGTIYKVTTAGAESVLHSFRFSDGGGAYPEGDLTSFGGVLYGTASQGGKYGYGDVFAFTP